MSRTISFTVPDAMYDAMIEEAAKHGQQQQPGQGKGIIARQAIRYWLSKQRHSTAVLDLDDKSYREYRNRQSRAVPSTRKHNGKLGTGHVLVSGSFS